MISSRCSLAECEIHTHTEKSSRSSPVLLIKTLHKQLVIEEKIKTRRSASPRFPLMMKHRSLPNQLFFWLFWELPGQALCPNLWKTPKFAWRN